MQVTNCTLQRQSFIYYCQPSQRPTVGGYRTSCTRCCCYFSEQTGCAHQTAFLRLVLIPRKQCGKAAFAQRSLSENVSAVSVGNQLSSSQPPAPPTPPPSSTQPVSQKRAGRQEVRCTAPHSDKTATIKGHQHPEMGRGGVGGPLLF